MSPTTSSFESNPILAPSRRALPDAQRLPAILSCYRDPNLARSVTEIAVTLAPFAALWAAMWGLMQISYGLALVLALPAAGFLVRLFMIQHDCGHGAFFRTRAINDWVGRGLGVLTLTPYAIFIVALMRLIGAGSFLMIQGPIFVLAATIGVWLFYVQHQFEDTRWARDGGWNHPEAALHGSSHYDLPAIPRWFSANIGVHHVHHLASRIPFYRLPEVLRDYPGLVNVGRLALWESLRCVNYSLWDQDTHQLISFRTLARQPAGRRGMRLNEARARMPIGKRHAPRA